MFAVGSTVFNRTYFQVSPMLMLHWCCCYVDARSAWHLSYLKPIQHKEGRGNKSLDNSMLAQPSQEFCQHPTVYNNRGGGLMSVQCWLSMQGANYCSTPSPNTGTQKSATRTNQAGAGPMSGDTCLVAQGMNSYHFLESWNDVSMTPHKDAT